LSEVHLSNPDHSIEGSPQRFPGDQRLKLIHRGLSAKKSGLSIVVIGLSDRVFF
jgi:hypothetical protein